jgi:penicillin-binding protein 1C
MPQIVWYVNGSPFALASPDTPVAWPLQAGEHKFQIGLPLRPERSAPVNVTVR